MGATPLVGLIVVFLTIGYFIGSRGNRSFMGDILVIALVAFIVPLLIVIFMGQLRYEGFMFVIINFLQLSLFGTFGILAGRFKVLHDEGKEE